jgi:hypothetical protein
MSAPLLPQKDFRHQGRHVLPFADHARLGQLCCYLFRPAVAQDRFRLLDHGRVVLALKTA